MTADDEAGAAPQRRASKSLAHTGSSEAKGGKELWKMAKQKVMREHLIAFTRVRAAHGRAPPSDEDRTPEFRALEVRVDGEAGTVFDTVRVSSKAPASLELDKDGTIHCMLEDTSEDPKLRDARLRQAAVAKLSLDTDPVEANKVGLFKVTSDQLERVDIVGRCGLAARARARRRVPASQSSGRCSSDPPLRPRSLSHSTITFYLRPGVRAQGADTDGIAAFQVSRPQTPSPHTASGEMKLSDPTRSPAGRVHADLHGRALLARADRAAVQGPALAAHGDELGPRRLQGLVEPHVRRSA